MNENTDNIQGVSKTGKAPKSRIKDAKAAYQLFASIKTDEDTAAYYRAQIQGLVDGNPPYSASNLRRSGQSWRSNVNFREAESIIETNAAAIWELDMEVPRLINAKVSNEDPMRSGVDYGGIIEEEYTRIVLEWTDYYFNSMLCTKEMLTFGIGPLFWPDKWDWRPKATKRTALLLPANSKATSGELELIGFRHSYQAHELYRMIDDEEKQKLAEDEGWNITLIRDALIRSTRNKAASSDDQKYQASTLEAIQQGLKNNDIAYSGTECDPIRVIHGLIKEYSGKVTHVIFYEDEEFPGYLYEGHEEFDSMEQTVCLFLWNIGDGYYKSVKGLGHRIYPHIELSNRQINTTIDGSFMTASLIVSAKGQNKDPGLIRLGPITVLSDGFEPIQQSFAPNLNQLIGVRTMLQQILNNNTGVYKKALEGTDMPERTAREVTIEEMRSAKIEKNQIGIYYLYQDAKHKEIFRRLTAKEYPENADGYEQAKKFMERCKDRGVPKELLNPEKCQVKATRAIGYGSATMRDMVTREVMQLMPGMDEIGKNNAMRDRLASLVGYTMTDRYLPTTNRDKIPTDVHSLATLENNDILNGQTVLVGVDQPHAIHWLVHFPLLANIAQAFMQSPQTMNIMASTQAMQLGIQHLAQHLQGLQTDPSRKAQVDVMTKQLDELVKVFQAMQKSAKKIQDEQAKQQQAQQEMVAKAQQVMQDREYQAQMAKVNAETDIKIKKAIGVLQLSQMKTQAGIAREDEKANAEIAREDTKAAG